MSTILSLSRYGGRTARVIVSLDNELVDPWLQRCFSMLLVSEDGRLLEEGVGSSIVAVPLDESIFFDAMGMSGDLSLSQDAEALH